MFYQFLSGYLITNILIVGMCLLVMVLLPLLKGEIPVLKKREVIIKFFIGLPISMVLFLFAYEVDISQQILKNQNINNELKEKLMEKRSKGGLSNLDLFRILYQYK
ncbi:MAG: hypothetical protein L0G02_12825 [Lactococcus lactis]|nr:hypothetical protein [Acinetobacter junii]ENV48962.1 hypothetical protein F953_03673 [Acinetobacter junii CIP 107470 = MTCC 11364]MDN5471276.1 hypothetical protein [Lactococcus lactis]